MFALDMQTFLGVAFQLLNTGILAFVLSWLLYKPVRKALQGRTERIQSQFTQAEALMSKATDLKLQYDQKLEDIKREREEILSEARKLAAETGERLVAEARKDAEALKARTSANIEMEWERAEADMRTAIVEVSAVLAEKYVSVSITKEAQDNLLADTMSALEGAKWRS